MRCLRGVKTNEDLHRFGDTTTAFGSMQSCGDKPRESTLLRARERVSVGSL